VTNWLKLSAIVGLKDNKNNAKSGVNRGSID
jgi:hypothetical protein